LQVFETPSLGSVCAGHHPLAVSVPVVSFPILLRQTQALGVSVLVVSLPVFDFQVRTCSLTSILCEKNHKEHITLDISMGDFAFVALEALDAKDFRGSWCSNT
jgi:hypothetical protein